MSKRPSALGLLAPIALILIAGFVYYARYHWARAWVDERFPWVKENVGSRLPSLVIAVDAVGKPIEVIGGPPQGEPVSSRFTSNGGGFDLPTLAAAPSAWPKTVKLKRAASFRGLSTVRLWERFSRQQGQKRGS